MKSRGIRRFNSDRIIEKRLRILRECMGVGLRGYKSREQKRPGLLRKHNLTCDCYGCALGGQYEENFNKRKEKNRFPRDWESEY